MKIQQLIDEQMQKIDRHDSDWLSKGEVEQIILSLARKLIEALGKEIINTKFKCGWKHDEEGVEYDLCDECRAVEEHKDEQHLKLKEIISSLK